MKEKIKKIIDNIDDIINDLYTYGEDLSFEINDKKIWNIINNIFKLVYKLEENINNKKIENIKELESIIKDINNKIKELKKNNKEIYNIYKIILKDII